MPLRRLPLLSGPKKKPGRFVVPVSSTQPANRGAVLNLGARQLCCSLRGDGFAAG